MKKLAIAAALAAGVTSFAVQAQEAPGGVHTMPAVASKAATDATAEKTVQPKASGAAARSARQKASRTRIELDRLPGVDPQTTASIGRGAPPELVAKARKGGAEKVTGGSYSDIIARYAAANGVPVALAHAVVRVESNYRANARGSAGEVGLMQIKPATARGLGYSGSTKGLYDPETNIRWGMKYLGMAHKLGGGSTCGTILKYNAGHAAKRMNPVSSAYCSKVKRQLAG